MTYWHKMGQQSAESITSGEQWRLSLSKGLDIHEFTGQKPREEVNVDLWAERTQAGLSHVVLSNTSGTAQLNRGNRNLQVKVKDLLVTLNSPMKLETL